MHQTTTPRPAAPARVPARPAVGAPGGVARPPAAGAAAAAAASRPQVSPADFDFVRSFVKRQAAITLEDGKEYLVTSRLAPLVKAHGVADIGALVALLRARPTGPIGLEIVDAMTTNETSFFRDIHPFKSLADDVVPALMKARAARRSLRIWCGAASSGQEPYTIALTLAEHFPELKNWRVEIIATDISPSMLAKAESGQYSQLEVNRGLPAPLLMKYFTRRGARWVINEDIRRMVRYGNLNLAERWNGTPGFAAQPFDIVFMRNVLIYFDVPTKAQILKQVRGHLADDGYLILGGAETTVGVQNDYRRVQLDRTVWYQAA